MIFLWIVSNLWIPEYVIAIKNSLRWFEALYLKCNVHICNIHGAVIKSRRCRVFGSSTTSTCTLLAVCPFTTLYCNVIEGSSAMHVVFLSSSIIAKGGWSLVTIVMTIVLWLGGTSHDYSYDVIILACCGYYIFHPNEHDKVVCPCKAF